MPSIKNRAKNGNGNFNFRVEKAKEQYEKGIQMNIPSKKKEHKEDIVKYVNEFLVSIMGMEKAAQPYYTPKKTKSRRIEYYKINPENKENIVWIKFTENGLISVIGTGCDIYFTDKTKECTTAGHINKELNLNWDETVVLIFPLKNIPDGLNRADIESGIGNYLISKDIPILDFYSHNY